MGSTTTLPDAHTRALNYFQSLNPDPAKKGYATERYKTKDDLAYAISRVPTLTPRPVRIICMGAGFGGIALARAVRCGSMPNVDLTVFEKDGGVGGTWWENRYPGCCCDVPAHSYQYTWAPNPHWSSYFAPQPEIQQYFESVADQHDLRPLIKLSHKVLGAKWIEERQVWQIKVCKTDGRDLVISGPNSRDNAQQGEPWIEECDVFVNAGGFFNSWRWPNVKGLDTFAGRKLHTAYWADDADKDIDGKTVAIIGNGSSGIQVLPGIIDRVKKVYVHMRSPTWLTSRIGEKYAGPKNTNMVFTEEQKKKWESDPAAYLQYRKDIEEDVNGRFRMYMDHTPEQEAARENSTANIRSQLEAGGRGDLVPLLTPDFAVGCRRPTPGTGYINALTNPKCEVVWGTVSEFSERGVVTDSGKESVVDTIVCATGFDLSITPKFPIEGRNGADLQKAWAKKPETYMSVAAADMPNYFTILGPASPLGHGSIVTSIERVVQFIRTMVYKLQTENYSSLCVKPKLAEYYSDSALAFLDRTVWASSCTSTYKNGTRDGELRSLHPGSRSQLFYMLAHPRYEDFEWTSLCRDPSMTFAWMANGFTLDETEHPEGVDNTWYVNPDAQSKAIKKALAANTDGVPSAKTVKIAGDVKGAGTL